MVVDADQISKSFGDRAIVSDFSTRILRGDRVGVVGANGAGKTTLLRLLTGALPPDPGKVRLGTNLEHRRRSTSGREIARSGPDAAPRH